MSKTLYILTERGPGWEPETQVICVTDSETLALTMQHIARRTIHDFGIEPEVTIVPFITDFDTAVNFAESVLPNKTEWPETIEDPSEPEEESDA